MSLILGRFKSKRKLGKGAYGDVLLVQDKNGQEVALKMISKKILSKDPFMEQYIEGQKQCMKSVKSPYIMELLSVEEDENFKYFVCEYCDGGDLLNYQAKQEKKVFTMKNATKILAEVILGLQLLHKMQYLHRDIKPQNILLKKAKDGNFLFKLADFGFAKRNQDVGGTVLGTQNYMSPQIYQNQIYSYQVDMWAFGVLFYFMLNMQFPFRINPHSTIEQKRQQLIKQAQKFSFENSVKNSKKKIMENCTPQTQDLFKQMFNPEGNKRITFVQIRQHPTFKDHFPNIDNQSRILYNKNKKKTPNKFQTFLKVRMSTIQPKGGVDKQKNFHSKSQPETSKNQQQNIEPSFAFKRPKTTQQKQIFEFQIEKVKFLHDSEEELALNLQLDNAEILAFRYVVHKYYIILLKTLINSMKPQFFQKKYPKLKWFQFFKTSQFNHLKRQTNDLLGKGEIKLSQTYDQCKNSLTAIKKYNPKIDQVLDYEVKNQKFDGIFKEVYRVSTMGIYEKVRGKFSNGNRYVYLTLMITLCHCYNQIINSSQKELQQIFSQFLLQKKSQNKFVDFVQLRSWLSQSDKPKLKDIIIKLLNKYFS